MEERILPQIPTPCQGLKKVAHTFISRYAKCKYTRPGGRVVDGRYKGLWNHLLPRFQSWVSIIVVLTALCPRSWTVVMSYPSSIKCVAKEWRNVCGVAGGGRERVVDQEVLRSL